MACVQKGDKSLCVTIDFQMINKNIIYNAYPLHRIDGQIYSMRGSAWFTALDLTKGYHQMNLYISSLRIYSIYDAYGTVSMDRLSVANLKVIVNKCDFAWEEVVVLGFKVSKTE